jgi:hypothetical protein
LRILDDFVLSFSRKGRGTICLAGKGGGYLNSDLRPTLIPAIYSA